VPSSPGIGNDATGFLGQASGVNIEADVRKGLQNSQVLIDFTRPEGTLAHLRICRELGVKLVIGTTGFTDEQKAEIAEAAKDIAIVMAPNMSVGVNVTLKLLQMAAQAMPTGYDIEIIEAHHRHKVDAPSGTALKMGEVIADAIGRDLKDCAVYERYGHTGERDPSTIGFSPSVVATSWETTPCCSLVLASASKSHTSRPAVPLMPKAACARPASWRVRTRACSTCLTC